MSNIVIRAASTLSLAGYGNDLNGWREWAPPTAEALRRGGLVELHWSMVFDSDPMRFSRMDLMCRLGLMTVELLDAGHESMETEYRDRIGVCVETCAGSLATDISFLQTPRPSLFTYTLPSTVIGEICIRYRLKGPVLCLMTPGTSGLDAVTEASQWLAQGDAGACVCLRCDAVDSTLAATVPLPGDLNHESWQAHAVLLGPASGQNREYALPGKSLAEICQALCGPAKQAC